MASWSMEPTSSAAAAGSDDFYRPISSMDDRKDLQGNDDKNPDRKDNSDSDEDVCQDEASFADGTMTISIRILGTATRFTIKVPPESNILLGKVIISNIKRIKIRDVILFQNGVELVDTDVFLPSTFIPAPNYTMGFPLRGSGKRARESHFLVVERPDMLPDDIPDVRAIIQHGPSLTMESFLGGISNESLEQLVGIANGMPKSGNIDFYVMKMVELVPEHNRLEALGERVKVVTDYLRARFMMAYNQFTATEGGARSHETFKNAVKMECHARAKIAAAASANPPAE